MLTNLIPMGAGRPLAPAIDGALDRNKEESVQKLVQAAAAGVSVNNGGWALCWLRQQGQQLLFPGSPVLIFLQSLSARGNLVGHLKEKLCGCAHSLHPLLLKASSLQQDVRPARQQAKTMRQLTDAGGICEPACLYGKDG